MAEGIAAVCKDSDFGWVLFSDSAPFATLLKKLYNNQIKAPPYLCELVALLTVFSASSSINEVDCTTTIPWRFNFSLTFNF